MKIEWDKLYNLYLAIVSFISIIAIALNLGIVLTSLWKYVLITDDEYLQFKEKWQIDNCNFYWTIEPNINPESKNQKPTQEEINACLNKLKKNINLTRNFELKDMFITSWAWFLIFLILFIFHYPKFFKFRKD